MTRIFFTAPAALLMSALLLAAAAGPAASLAIAWMVASFEAASRGVDRLADSAAERLTMAVRRGTVDGVFRR